MSIFDYNPEAARAQSLFAALLAGSSQGLAAAGPSTQPGGFGRSLAAFGPAFINAQQGYMGNQQNMALRALQMKKIQEELAQQEEWRKMLGGMQPQSQTGSTMFDNQGGQMLAPGPADPADGSQGGMFAPQAQQTPSIFGNTPPEARPLVGQLGPKAGAAYLLKSQYGQPSNIQEWNEFQKMSPQDQSRYLVMRRAMQPAINLGDRVVQPDPMRPGMAAGEFQKGLPPQDQPEVRGAQKFEATKGEAGAKREFNMMGIGEVIASARSYLTGEATGTKPTASGVGSYADTAAGFFGKTLTGAPEADVLRAIGGALTSKMPRMEGPQSDLDQKLYREMAGQVGDAGIPIERRLLALKEVERLWAKYDSKAQGGTNQPKVGGGWGIREIR